MEVNEIRVKTDWLACKSFGSNAWLAVSIRAGAVIKTGALIIRREEVRQRAGLQPSARITNHCSGIKGLMCPKEHS